MSELNTVTEAPKQRTAEQINAEYAQVCTQIGDLIVKRGNMDKAIAALHDRVAQLDAEIKAIPAKTE